VCLNHTRESRRPFLASSKRSPLVEIRATASATAEALEALHEALEHFWQAVDVQMSHGPATTWRLQLSTAIGEVGANIIQHAHPPGTPPTMVDLRLRMFPDRVVVRFADRGVAYAGSLKAEDADTAPEVGDELELMEGGYGLAIARAALDVVQYRRTRQGTNLWRLVKYWEPNAD
jgi:anti-sigma regulatory factor (Ser/Thr protein kinase)